VELECSIPPSQETNGSSPHSLVLLHDARFKFIPSLPPTFSLQISEQNSALASDLFHTCYMPHLSYPPS